MQPLEVEVKYANELIPMVGYGCHRVSALLHDAAVRLMDFGDEHDDQHTRPGFWYGSANDEGFPSWNAVDLEWVAPETCEAIRNVRSFLMRLK